MTTETHSLRWISTLEERDAGVPLEAYCSCGKRWAGVVDEEAMYASHEDHILIDPCTDHWHCDPATAAHRCDAPDRTEPCPECGADNDQGERR